jgi:IS5 family transposase
MRKQKRESRYVKMARLILKICRQIIPRYRHPNSPQIYTQPQLLATVLMGKYLDLSYRDMVEWLLATDKVCAALELDEVPHHSTLCRTMQRTRMPRWRQLLHQLLASAGVAVDGVSIDSTGLLFRQASAYYRSRTDRKLSRFVKCFTAVDIDSQLILDWRFELGPNSDMDRLDRLRRGAHRYGRLINGRHEYVVLADKAFDGAQARPTDLIEPRQGPNRRVVRPDRRARLDFTSQARLDGFFGQRWKVETVYSVIKRKSGDAVAARKRLYQQYDLAAKVLAYNFHRL